MAEYGGREGGREGQREEGRGGDLRQLRRVGGRKGGSWLSWVGREEEIAIGRGTRRDEGVGVGVGVGVGQREVVEGEVKGKGVRLGEGSG